MNILRMCLCPYVHVCLCLFVSECVWFRVRVCVCGSVYVFVCVCVVPCTCLRVCVWMFAHVYVCVYVCVRPSSHRLTSAGAADILGSFGGHIKRRRLHQLPMTASGATRLPSLCHKSPLSSQKFSRAFFRRKLSLLFFSLSLFLFWGDFEGDVETRSGGRVSRRS